MGSTLSDAIIARAAGRARVSPGDVVWANVDLAMIQDSAGPRRIAPGMERLGATVWDRERLIVVADHFSPANSLDTAGILNLTRQWASQAGVRFHNGEGISHTLMVQERYVRPGWLFAGGDSHTCTAGVLGCLALGVGSTDMLGVVCTGQLWVRVPLVIRVEITGQLRYGVTAKDFMLSMIADKGMDGATYKVLEFGGPAVEAMAVDERSVLTNMCAEIGAKTGIIPADEVTWAHLAEHGIDRTPVPDVSDPDYTDVWRYDAGQIGPVVARPHTMDDVVGIDNVAGQPVTRAYIGACTGAKYADLIMAAEVLHGRRVADGVQLHVAPSSQKVLERAAADGTLTTLVTAGARILGTGCGACPGHGSGLLGPGDVCISTTNRNFQGRMGSPEAQIYLASPYSVAAAAVAGEICDPGQFLAEATK